MDAFWRLHVFLFLIGLSTVTGNTFIPCKGYRGCTCSKQNVFKCRNTNYIQRPPIYIVKVELLNNFYPLINRTTFMNITLNNITSLIMKNNSIKAIQRDSFSDLRYLRKLEISNEMKLSVNELKSSFGSLNIETFDALRLEHNGLKDLPNDFFQQFQGANLSLISMNFNQIAEIGIILRPLAKLHYLYLINNIIVSVDPNYLNIVQHIDLSDNNIYLVPNFCGPNKTKNVASHRLKSLYLTNNAIRDISAHSFDCLDNLEILNVDGNRIHALGNNVFSRLPKLKKMSLSKMPQLKRIYDEALNVSSLQVLSFAQNGFHFERSFKYNPEKIFYYLTNLQELDLTNSFLPCHDFTKLLTIFSPLQLLRKMVLVHTGLCYIPGALLSISPNLEILNLMGNKLSRWNNNVFSNVTSLRVLILGGNNIHFINETSFSGKMLSSLNRLDLSDNPFWCTCDQKWFLDVLRSTNLTNKMTNWPRRYTCQYPEHLHFTRLLHYYPTYVECNLLSIIILCVSVTAVFIFSIVVVMLRCQVNIRNALYFIHVYRRLKTGYFRLNSSTDFEYDVFIVYCDADRQWVHCDLLQRLENSGSKVCIHHRDFDVGEHITTNIENFMDKSWKIVVIMSNKFAESEWCQWEVDLILERRRKQGKAAVILIMYQQIDSLHMTSSLRSLLDTTPHLSVVQGVGRNLFWKTLLKAVNTPLSFPPTAIQ